MLPFTYEATLRVRYGETDQMGVVWHGTYLAYFEVARTDALRALGHSYRNIEASGVMMPVVEAGISYKQSARFDDVLTVKVEVRERPTARMRFDYSIIGPDGGQIATGFTVLAFLDRETRRPCKPPAFLRELF